MARVEPPPAIRPTRFQGCLLDYAALDQALPAAEADESGGAAAAAKVLSLPMPDGSFQRFRVTAVNVMPPELAAKFPRIRTFIGEGIDDPSATARFDITPLGFHAQVLSPHGAVYVDPYGRDDEPTFHASYFKRDLVREAAFSCGVRNDGPAAGVTAATRATTSGDTLRTYRLACAATGEYTAYFGGTVENGLAAVVTAINRINGVYETEFGVRLQLVANNDRIIYTNGQTDPYSNDDPASMLDQNQTTLNSTIGRLNYDVGHVFGTGGGGIAGLGVVCDAFAKAYGVTGLFPPTGDPFWIDYVAHEMGHQFGADHTFNSTAGSCCCGNRWGPSAYEPGSGSTIMSYAGICGVDNLQPHSDPYFHSVSLDEIRTEITSGIGSTCGTVTVTGNNAPIVDAGLDYVIPKGTPFALTAAASDPDGDPVTLDWEERDLGPAVTLNTPDNGVSPLFRVWNPTLDATRVFPQLPYLLMGVLPPGEKLPSVGRTMTFRAVARDHRVGAGVASDEMKVVVDGSAGPFRVIRPNSNLTLSGLQLVTWTTAGTNAPAVNATTVSIWLSVDGGVNFNVPLAQGVPNDGAELVELPAMSSSAARIKIEADGNVFFDVSDQNFTLVPCIPAAAPTPEPQPQVKNRYISFRPGNADSGMAIRVQMFDLPGAFANHQGEIRWVGPPALFANTESPPTTFVAAQLQCEPHYQDWTGVDVLHVYGGEIVPDARYEVRNVHCDPSDLGAYSNPLIVGTGPWGDVAPVYSSPEGLPQPDVLDVAGAVDRLKSLPSAPAKMFVQLQPQTVNPAANVTVLDLASTIDALKGFPYPYAWPAACPP